MESAHGGPVIIESGSRFMTGATGRWAGERFAEALRRGEELSTSHLRTLDTLRKDEWKYLDEQLVEEARMRLRGVRDLVNAGLTRTVPGSLGRTIFEYEKVSDMQPAAVSLDGVTQTNMDRQEFTLGSVPLPLVHKDFYLNLRTLTASRNRGEPLDTMQIRTCGRLVAETQESMLFNGSKVYGGASIYGYRTHPDRNLSGFGTNGAWSATAKTGPDCLADVNTLIKLAEGDRMFGPYALYVSRNCNAKLNEDFKSATASSQSIRDRLLMLDGISFLGVIDQMPNDNVLLVQLTSDVVTWVQGEPLQTVQWDVQGGFHINYKAFTICVPLIRSDAQGRSGIQHMS